MLTKFTDLIQFWLVLTDFNRQFHPSLVFVHQIISYFSNLYQGTVMCSPGCFSLLRGSTLLEDHILPIYVTKAHEANDFVQYDQGEDRWLSTLIIQQGYFISYVSAADSMTYAPETFHEYYNQRRRWIPSTIVNLIDFLKDYRHVLRVNGRITWFFVFYIFINFMASLLGPSTVLIMIADTLQNAYGKLNQLVNMISNIWG